MVSVVRIKTPDTYVKFIHNFVRHNQPTNQTSFQLSIHAPTHPPTQKTVVNKLIGYIIF